MNAAHLSVVIVTYNSADTLESCLRSVPQESEVIVVDQASADHSATIAKDLRPHAKVIHAGGNRGFGAGCNLGAANATRPITAFLNPDASFADDAADQLAAAAAETNSMVGPTILDSSGVAITKARRWSSTTTDILDLVVPHRFLPERWQRDIPAGSDVYRTGGEVAYIQGACMVIPTALFWGVGGFDERYFLYSEEETLATKLAERGHRCWLVPDAIVAHVGAASTSGVRTFSVEQYHRSRAISLVQRHSLAGAIPRVAAFQAILLVLWVTAPIRKIIGFRKTENAQFCVAAIRGLFNGLIGRGVVPPPGREG
jgi:N-acetylglucosaminyl-diphospho-decaprenol L-rhamnosyltransferase